MGMALENNLLAFLLLLPIMKTASLLPAFFHQLPCPFALRGATAACCCYEK
jgi:hypothetical protein